MAATTKFIHLLSVLCIFKAVSFWQATNWITKFGACISQELTYLSIYVMKIVLIFVYIGSSKMVTQHNLLEHALYDKQ